ncbi:MAG: aldolase/citrate lyase family protein [Negativicutes bacterium]|nr:aldolase/citrate lyase family protein [Negativicutes bacterium]
MKEKIIQGNPVLGLSVMIPSAQIVEMAGRLGFDWVLIDCEHGSISLETVELMTMAAEASNIVPIVRPPKNDPEIILQYLDRGAMGIQAPHVSTASQAEAIVAAVKYHPLGTRSLAVGTRSARYGFKLNLSEYAEEANRETLICVQIEDKEALDNVAAISRVAGIDVVFLGPSDLSQSMGYPGAAHHPAVQAAMQQAFTTILQTGKAAGTAGNFENAALRLNQGITYYYTHLTTVLARGSAEFFALAKKG